MSSKGGSSGGMWSVFIHGHDARNKGSKTHTSGGGGRWGGGSSNGLKSGVDGSVKSGTGKIETLNYFY
ncbi:VACAC2 218 [Vaccinia virus]|nr:VACAC2 218 [Vaccinia virus]